MIHKLAAAFAVLFLLQISPYAQTVLLHEDFSSETLPSGWTNDSLGNSASFLWLFDNPGNRTIAGTGFDTSFVILDSDHFGQGNSQDASLTTDTFSATNLTSVILELDEQYFTQGTNNSVRKIEASATGFGWFMVDTDTSSLGYPVAVHSTFNLDTFAGATGIMLRFTYSGTWDYWWAIDNITVTGYPLCSAPPTAGQAQSSHSTVCNGSQFTLSLSGSSAGAGITYQWQSSPDSINWTDIPGASSAALLTSQTATFYYRAVLTCSAQSDSSATVIVGMNPSTLCYCIPQTPSCGSINYISGVTIDGTTLVNYSSCQEDDSGFAYVSYPASGSATATLHQNSTYQFNIYSTGTNIISLWIDYNHSGTFDSSEWNQVSTNSNGLSSVNIQVPDTALQGLTGMRFRTRAVGNSNGYGDACTAFLSGETEDYYISIDTLLNATHDLDAIGIAVYPNPASGIVTIDFGQSRIENVSISLFSILGSEIKTVLDKGISSIQLDVSDVPGGLYMLRINEGKRIAVRKLVIKE